MYAHENRLHFRKHKITVSAFFEMQAFEMKIGIGQIVVEKHMNPQQKIRNIIIT